MKNNYFVRLCYDNNYFVRLCYDNNFFNTVGLIDSLLVKMISSLLNINIDGKKINIYRNNNRYLSSSLIVSFDNLFVDIRFNIYSDVIYEGMNSYINIFNNTYGLSFSNYNYVMINFVNNSSNFICNEYSIMGLYDDFYGDKFKIVNFNYFSAYSLFISNRSIDNYIKWLSLLYVDNMRDLYFLFRDNFVSNNELINLIFYINHKCC